MVLSSNCAACLQLPPSAARTPAPNDEPVARFALLAGTAFFLAPRRRGVASTGALAFAAAHGVVDGVHGDAARVRALALPARPPGLADRHEAGLAVADRAHGCPAVDRHAAHLGRGQPQRGERAFLGDQLDCNAGAAAQLGARTRLQLDVVHGRADGDVAQRQRVADADLGTLSALQYVTDCEAFRSDDVALLAVEVVEQRDARVAVRVVLDRCDLCGYAVLRAAEVDHAIPLLVPTAAVTRCHPAVAVAATTLRLGLRERLLGLGLGDLREVRRRLEPPSGARRLAFTNGHVSSRRCRCG